MPLYFCSFSSHDNCTHKIYQCSKSHTWLSFLIRCFCWIVKIQWGFMVTRKIFDIPFGMLVTIFAMVLVTIYVPSFTLCPLCVLWLTTWTGCRSDLFRVDPWPFTMSKAQSSSFSSGAGPVRSVLRCSDIFLMYFLHF